MGLSQTGMMVITLREEYLAPVSCNSCVNHGDLRRLRFLICKMGTIYK